MENVRRAFLGRYFCSFRGGLMAVFTRRIEGDGIPGVGSIVETE
jgi:hypothetical protein